jgi:hypothetical protein
MHSFNSASLPTQQHNQVWRSLQPRKLTRMLMLFAASRKQRNLCCDSFINFAASSTELVSIYLLAFALICSWCSLHHSICSFSVSSITYQKHYHLDTMIWWFSHLFSEGQSLTPAKWWHVRQEHIKKDHYNATRNLLRCYIYKSYKKYDIYI